MRAGQPEGEESSRSDLKYLVGSAQLLVLALELLDPLGVACLHAAVLVSPAVEGLLGDLQGLGGLGDKEGQQRRDQSEIHKPDGDGLWALEHPPEVRHAQRGPDLAVATEGSKGVSILLNGGPSPRTLTLSYRRHGHRFTGRLRSTDPACIRSQRVKVLRRRHGRDHTVGAATTSKSGTYSIRKNARRGTYYARVRAWSACRTKHSKTITINRHQRAAPRSHNPKVAAPLLQEVW